MVTSAQAQTANEFFRWGAASAAYQVEGAFNADGKGRSISDVYLDNKSLARPGVSGSVATNFYDRRQYLKVIALFEQMGLTSYRFSISWPRIVPDGLGPVIPPAVAHYRQFITDLKAAGIQPMTAGADVRYHHVWSSHDNLEWLSGYGRRFGLIYVDFDTQQRTPKLSSSIYARLINGEAPTSVT